MPRLFVALELPPHVRQRLASLALPWPGGAASAEADLHVTLRFLGSFANEAVPRIAQALTAIKTPSFALAIDGFGVFPGGRRPPAVLWAGLKPWPPLIALKETVDV